MILKAEEMERKGVNQKIREQLAVNS